MELPTEPGASITFGRFRVVPHDRELFVDGRPIRLGARAFDLLLTLIEAGGTVASKDLLMERVWPGRIVEENNLQAQISMLRTAFGADRDLIRTIPGRGYQFTGEARTLPPRQARSPEERPAASVAAPGPGTGLPPSNLAEPVSDLIGRDRELREIVSLAAAHRLVTLTGPGGIGKTRLALAVARGLLPQFADGVWLAEFSPLSDPGLLPATVAAAAGIELPAGGVSAQRLAQALSSRRVLLVLDTCEHVIDEAAALAEAVLRGGAEVCMIATSREPLRVEGEQLYPVPPLAVPAVDGQDPWGYDAVQLFVARSRGSGAQLSQDRHAHTIAAICRRLDGIPLAIELSAARAAALGIEALAARLDDRFNLLTGGWRTALPRHQTLRATLDWSYGLLPDAERVILRRVALFAGLFSLAAACAVVASPGIGSAAIVDGISSLVAKSIVATEAEREIVRYRLVDTTRAYGLEKLADSGEREQIARSHAEYYRDLFEHAESDQDTGLAPDWRANYARYIDNLRAALDWAFSATGDASIGVALTAAAVPLWMHLSLLEECHDRVRQALAALAAGGAPDDRREMKLQAALGEALMFGRGNAEAVRAAFLRALHLAEALHDFPRQLQVLRGLHLYLTRLGDFRGALVTGEQAQAVAKSLDDPSARTMADWMLGVAQHLMGDQPPALVHCESAMIRPRGGGRPSLVHPWYDDRIIALVALARARWLLGYPDRAVEEARYAVTEAERLAHPLMLCIAIIYTVYVFLWIGDWQSADALIERLVSLATRYALGPYQSVAIALRGEVLTRRGQPSAGVPLLRRHLETLLVSRHQILGTVFAATLAEGLTVLSQVDEALAVLDQAIAQVGSAGESFDVAELFRVKGHILGSAGTDAEAAETCLRQALDWARRQGALSWELRAATSLARLLSGQDRSRDAMALLQPVYDRFTEGFETADLKAARALLDALRA